jgi:hypothetical protein
MLRVLRGPGPVWPVPPPFKFRNRARPRVRIGALGFLVTLSVSQTLCRVVSWRTLWQMSEVLLGSLDNLKVALCDVRALSTDTLPPPPPSSLPY